MPADAEFHIGHFGDVRREAVGARLFERVMETGCLVLRRLGEDRNGEGAIGNFLGSPHVTPEEIVHTAGKRTAQACRGRRIVAAQDTTEINFSGRHARRRGLGAAGDGETPGFFAHAMIAIDADDEAVLGLVHAQIWTRTTPASVARRARAIEDKESIRWIKATAAAGDLLAAAAQLIVVGDREFDIYSQFVRVPPGVDLIVRAAQNRKLADEDGSLFSAPSDWREFGTLEIRVPPSPGKTQRIARVTVKAGRVCIAKPRNGGAASDPDSVSLTYVEVAEVDPPKGEDPIVWRLLTTLAVLGEPDEFAAAREIVRLYRLRWRIEQLFRAMKSDGLRLEETQVQDATRLFNLTAVALTAAVRTSQLVDARDGSPRPASDVADPQVIAAAQAIGPTLEGNTQRQKNPHTQGSLSWLSWIVARLGGWNCYYKPPGPKTMRAGWDVLAAMANGYAIAMAQQKV
ncbi:MAG TPA: IS4 family transposase [Alphaproteobacteria bacterium]|nr:IS4 family transposase [Alphaproteobacteria bacterium]